MAKRHTWIRYLVLGTLFFLALPLLLNVAGFGGTKFTVTNASSEVIRSVSVRMNGDVHYIGHISPGGSESVMLIGRVGSHIELLYADMVRLSMDCDLGGGYIGAIAVKVAAGNGATVTGYRPCHHVRDG